MSPKKYETVEGIMTAVHRRAMLYRCADESFDPTDTFASLQRAAKKMVETHAEIYATRDFFMDYFELVQKYVGDMAWMLNVHETNVSFVQGHGWEVKSDFINEFRWRIEGLNADFGFLSPELRQIC